MKKQKIYVFGQQPDQNWLNSATVGELVEEARERSAIAARPDIECILGVLNDVSQAWADPEYHLRRKAAEVLPELTAFSEQMIVEGFKAVSAICRRENLEKRLKGEFGSMAVLDAGLEKPHHDYNLRALPRGVLLHLTAGNVFVGAVDSLVSGIITKNVNILKMSRVDTVFPVLFIESIKEHDPAGIIWPNQAAVLWKGGDESIENTLLQAHLTVIFWGGYDALQSVKARIGATTKLIENGPRYSFAVVEGQRLKKDVSPYLISGLAKDLSLWDQQACSSPHVVYVVGAVAQTHQLMEALYDEMVSLSQELPVGNLSFNEKVEIRKVRDITRMLQARGEGRLMCPEAFSFSLILENDPIFKVSCLNRTLFFKTVKNCEDLIEQVRPLADYLQTVGLYCNPEMSQQLCASFFELGAKRMTDIGGMSEGHEGAPHDGVFVLRQLVDWVGVEVRDTPESRVEHLMSRISGSPYYRGLLNKVGGCGFEHFMRLPLLDRDTFYKNSPPASSDILTGPMTDAYVYASGGTTGEPKFTLYSNDEYRLSTDLLAEIFKNAGICREDRVANLFIAGNLWTSFNVSVRALENLGCLQLPIGGSSDIENILKYIRLFEVNTLVGLPSIIINLAEEIERRKLPIKIEKILYGGEHIRPQTREFLERVLGTTLIRSAGYACVDTGPIGWQCQYIEGSAHHVCTDHSYVEILEPETGRPPADPTAAGELVATNLTRVLMPVVRYRTGDLGRWQAATTCRCGFSGRSFELLGRCDDLLVIGGINLMPVDVAAGLNGLPVNQSFQAVARNVAGKDHLLLRLEADKPLSDAKIIAALKKGSYKIAESIKDNWMTISIEWFKPGSIPRNQRTGKLKPIIDERH